MYRNELKFFVNAYQKTLMTNKLANLCERDGFSDADGGYLVSSLYFDDYSNSAFYDKVNGIKDRKKFRLRAYNRQSDHIKLERKIKRAYASQKSHVEVSKLEYEALVKGNISFLRQKDHSVANDFFLTHRTKHLRPTVTSEYRREAFIFKYGDVRICFDYFLKAGVFQKGLFSNEHMTSVIPHNQIILEVKYTGYIPDVIRSIIQVQNLQWQSNSKYAKCFVAGR